LGVKVYVPVAVLLTIAGLHVPLMPLVEVVGNTGAVLPAHIAAMGAKLVVNIGLTVTVIVVGTAHEPATGVGVKV